MGFGNPNWEVTKSSGEITAVSFEKYGFRCSFAERKDSLSPVINGL